MTGTVVSISKDSSTITVRQANVARQVVYDNHTLFTVHNGQGSLADLKEGTRVISLGRLNDKGQLVATHIDVR